MDKTVSVLIYWKKKKRKEVYQLDKPLYSFTLAYSCYKYLGNVNREFY